MLQIHGSAGSVLVSDDYYEHRTPTGGGLNKLGTLLDNSREILTQKVGAVIRRKSSDVLYLKAAQYFIKAIRGQVHVQAAMWDAVNVHHVLAALAASVEQGRPVECGTLPAKMRQGGA